MGTLSKPHVTKCGIGYYGLLCCYSVCHMANIVTGEFKGMDIDIDTDDSDASDGDTVI
jgi:hypothetical protein